MAERPVTRTTNATQPAAAPALSSQPWLYQQGKKIQAFGTVRTEISMRDWCVERVRRGQ
jgi:hypothetical protein